MLHDLLFASRLMRRTPAFTTVVVFILALGIGSTTAVFSILDTVMRRPLPVNDPHQLVEILTRYPGEERRNFFDWTAYERFRDHARSFSEIIATAPVPIDVAVGRDPAQTEAVIGEGAVGDFFQSLGLRPALGRLLSRDDDRIEGNPRVAVLSWTFWRSHFSRDPSVIGRTIAVNGIPVTVVGVASKEFYGLQLGRTPALWVPSAFAASATRTAGPPRLALLLVGRLKAGVPLAEAQAELRLLDRPRLEQLAANGKDPTWLQAQIELASAAAGLGFLRDRFGHQLMLLMTVVAVLLLIACLNIATLLAAKGASRRQEVAVRLALGASRWRLLRQLLTESVLLALAGGVLAVAFASTAARTVLLALPVDPRSRVRLDEVPMTIDGRMLLFAGGITLLTALVFGLMPAWRAFSAVASAALRSSRTGRDRLYEKGLVAMQVACAIVLTSLAMLLTGHVSTLKTHNTGFQHDAVLVVALDRPRANLTADARLRLYQEVLQRLRSIAGVRSGALAALTPIQPGAASRFLYAEGVTEPVAGRPRVALNWVGPQYFEAVRTPLVAGRDFADADEGSQSVAIVNERLARQYFGDARPLGRRFTLERGTERYEIVGIAADAKYSSLHEPAPPTAYLHALQGARGDVSQFVLRTAGDPASFMAAVRHAVGQASAPLSISRLTTLRAQVDGAIVTERLLARLSSSIGFIGVLLAAIGVYGLLAFSVALRTREIGVRVVLGATPRRVLRAELGRAAWLLAAGTTIGVPVAFWTVRVCRSMVPNLEVGPVEPIAAGVAALALASLIGAWLPARSASRVQPADALRHL